MVCSYLGYCQFLMRITSWPLGNEGRMNPQYFNLKVEGPSFPTKGQPDKGSFVHRVRSFYRAQGSQTLHLKWLGWVEFHII